MVGSRRPDAAYNLNRGTLCRCNGTTWILRSITLEVKYILDFGFRNAGDKSTIHTRSITTICFCTHPGQGAPRTKVGLRGSFYCTLGCQHLKRAWTSEMVNGWTARVLVPRPLLAVVLWAEKFLIPRLRAKKTITNTIGGLFNILMVAWAFLLVFPNVIFSDLFQSTPAIH